MFGETNNQSKTMKEIPMPEIPRDAIKACIECFEVNEATDRIAGYIESMMESDRAYYRLMMRLEEIEKATKKSK
jgi:hypothetical protein